ncbi:MAG: flagellar biosynthesis anti-sigma factor FlgM [Treponema sp.]|nr:flagellar biosynthesis anti-sigma factor FlgM [Treponema sp.]MCL2269868.1 flagellar biosynthesis anti-sigma factor FlgM [Treponema sp.]
MMVERIGHLDPIQPGNRTGKSDQLRGGDRADSISLSPEAREKAELFQVVELIKSAPSLDDAQIAALREKINDPAYINGTIGATADRIMDAFGL